MPHSLTLFSILAGLIAPAILTGCQPLPAPNTDATVPPETEVLRLLRQELKDQRNDERFSSAVTARLRLFDARFWSAVYSSRHAKERLVSFGTRIIAPCIRIVTDPNQDASLVEVGFEGALFAFDDPRVAVTLLDPAVVPRFDKLQYYVLVLHLLSVDAISAGAGGLRQDNAQAWLREVADKGTYAPVLSLLDSTMKRDLLYSDPCLIRWLNRLGSDDIDELLAAKAPQALAWRNQQLQKGFDPLVAFYSGLAGPVTQGTLEVAIRQIYPDAEDQERCRELFDLAYGQFEGPSGWEDRLREWYWKNRERFVYDFERHRFVVEKARDGHGK